MKRLYLAVPVVWFAVVVVAKRAYGVELSWTMWGMLAVTLATQWLGNRFATRQSS